MPRSPLADKLTAIAAVVDHSDHAGIPVDEVLSMRADAGSPAGAMSRRSMLRMSGLGVAGAALAACDAPGSLVSATAGTPEPGFAKTSAPTERVAVVGAGLAGLTTAYRLQQAGVNATLYEAQSRTGGRCWTNRTTFNGQIAEHGGELIDQSHSAIRALAQQLGLPLDNVLAAEPNGTDALYFFNGAPYTEAQVAQDLKAVWQPLKRDYVEAGYPTLYNKSTARGRELDAMSIASWLDSRVPGGRSSRLGKLLETAYVIEYGADAPVQSALNLVYLLGAVGQGNPRLFGQSNEKYKVRGGNDQIATRMASALGSRIQGGVALRAIVRKGATYELLFDGRSSVIADRVVLAIPFSVLRERVDISQAGFPTLKNIAINELGMGSNAKLALQFTSRRWNALGGNGDSFSDTGYQATWEVTRAQPGAAGILVNYTGGSVTDAQSGGLPSSLANKFLTQIAPVMPGLASVYNNRVFFDDWPRNPWTLGSYSYFKVGQYTRFAGAESEIAGACHFAGEHTSIDSQGYLNGAVESGERAAREVMAALGLVPKA